MPDSSTVLKPVYSVVSPVGEFVDDNPTAGSKAGKISAAAPIADLNGKKIGLIWSAFKNGNVFLEAMESLLSARFKNMEFVRLPAGKGLRWGDLPQESIADVAKEADLDGAIAAVAGCGGCSIAVASTMTWLEAAGIPTAGVVCQGFDNTVRLTAKFRGLADTRLVAFPPPNISVQSPEEVHTHALSLVDKVVAELTQLQTSGAAAGMARARTKPREIVFSGDVHELNEFFHENRWTEGLPIVPPTIAAVEAMLKFTDRDPDEVIGVLQPGRCVATTWKTAVNGVMAGCRPEYMPILLSIIEVLADENSGIEGFNSTAGLIPIVVLNGPLIKELNINHGQGMMRARRQANMSISRFLSLCLINIAQLRLGETDMTVFDRNYFPLIAEAEDESPWEPLNVSLGFKPGSNLITVQSAAAIGYCILSEGDAEDHLRTLAQEVARDLGNSHYMIHPTLGPVTSPMICISPQVANIIAKAGYSKQDVKQYLFDHGRVPAHQLEEFMHRHALLSDIDPKDITFCEMVKRGLLPQHFCPSSASAEPGRLVPVVQNPDEFVIVVTGFPTRNRSRILRQGGCLGRRTYKEIRLPPNWQQLLKTLT